MTDTHEARPGGEVVVYEAPEGEVRLNVRLALEPEATCAKSAQVRHGGGRKAGRQRTRDLAVPLIVNLLAEPSE